MSFRIGSNVGQISTQRFLSKSQREVENSLKRLSSGSRVANAGDDAAGFAIAQSLKSQVRGLKAASQNAENATSLIQTAEGGLNEQNNILVRLRELSVSAASDTVSDNEREFIDKEFQALSSEFDRIAKSTRFGNKKLLTGSGEEFEFHVGAFKGEENVIKFKLDSNTSADEVGIDGLNVQDKDDAIDSLEQIDEAMTKMAGVRASFGAAQSRFNYAIDNLSVQTENMQLAQSRVADVDIASEVANLTSNRILQDIGVAVMAQANSDSTRALQLIHSL